MNRWIVFDQPTANAVKTQSGDNAEVRPASQAKVVAGVLGAQHAVGVLPTGTPGKVLLMHAQRRQRPQGQPKRDNHLAPAGFLGLSDSIDMDTEPEPPKKWWKKITG
ncbi:MAG: hypothetical protein ACR2IF_14750 [Terriglobales bacterium]